jgi:hypothetical protein
MRKLLTIMFVVAAGVTLLSASSGAADSADSGVEIHGFVSQGFVQTTKANNFPVSNSGQGSFNFNDFGINFSKEITPDLHVGMQLFAFDRGNYGRDKITLDWAYGDYRYKDWLGFRAGKVKIPLGLYNEARDNDALRTFIFLPQQAYFDYERDSLVAILGGAVYGSVPLGEAGTLNYQVEVGSVPAVADGGFAREIGGMLDQNGLNITDINSKLSVAHSLEWRTPVPGLRALVTGLHTTLSGTATGIDTTGASVDVGWKYDSLHRYMFSAEYTYKDLVLSGEYELDDYTLRTNFPDGSTGPSRNSNGDLIGPSKQATDSWCAMATYRFTDWFELGGFYHEVYADRHHRDGSSHDAFGLSKPENMWWKDAALTLRFDPVSNIVLKVEGHYINGNYEIIENIGGARKDWFLFATKATYSF